MMYLSEAPDKIWEYKQYNYLALPEEEFKYSEMTNSERKFVHGLIQYMQPKRVLEIGVAEGGGSLVILNALKDIPGATLTSIDLMEKCWNDFTKDVGFACQSSTVNKENWTLCVGNDPCNVIESLSNDEKFDFAIIDTRHIHPVESLNFLCVLPFLSENCTVLLHDLSLYTLQLYEKGSSYTPFSNFPTISLATKLLFDTMVGEKRKLPLSEYIPAFKYPNIGVCQLDKNSRKYIGNIFSMLQFPWGCMPTDIVEISSHLKKHYSDEYYQVFNSALEATQKLIQGGKSIGKYLNTNSEHYGKKKIVLYGFGDFFKSELLQTDIFSHHIQEVWDKFESTITITSASGKQYNIQRPQLNYEDKDSLLIVITLSPLGSECLIKEIKEELNSLGFANVIHYLDLDEN